MAMLRHRSASASSPRNLAALASMPNVRYPLAVATRVGGVREAAGSSDRASGSSQSPNWNPRPRPRPPTARGRPPRRARSSHGQATGPRFVSADVGGARHGTQTAASPQTAVGNENRARGCWAPRSNANMFGTTKGTTPPVYSVSAVRSERQSVRKSWASKRKTAVAQTRPDHRSTRAARTSLRAVRRHVDEVTSRCPTRRSRGTG